MPASTPEEIPSLLAAAEIRTALEPIFAGAPMIENEVVGTVEGDGLALIHSRWALEATSPDGRPLGLAGRGTIVSRRQPNGNWLIVLENTLSPE